MIVTRKALSRRTVLRGVGASLALPLLDAMIPALTAAAQTPAKGVRRLGVVYHPNGVIYDKWLPKGSGADYELSPTLAGLQPHLFGGIHLPDLVGLVGPPVGRGGAATGGSRVQALLSQPALQGPWGDTQVFSDLVMAPPTVGHQESLATVAQTAVGSGFKGVFELLAIVIVQGDMNHESILPDRSLGG